MVPAKTIPLSGQALHSGPLNQAGPIAQSYNKLQAVYILEDLRDRKSVV